MSSPRKRKRTVLENTNSRNASQPTKRRKSSLIQNETCSTSNCRSDIIMLSAMEEDTETVHIQHTSSSHKRPKRQELKYPWLKNGNCIVTKHKIVDQYYQFMVEKVDSKQDRNEQLKKLRNRLKWLSHHDISHLDCYQMYLKENEITVEDATNEQYVVEKIINHQKSTNGLKFEVKWAGYKETSWEPQENLTNNGSYIKYCKRNHIDLGTNTLILLQCTKCNKHRIVFDWNSNDSVTQTDDELKHWQCIMNGEDCVFEQVDIEYIRKHLSDSQIMQLQTQISSKDMIKKISSKTLLAKWNNDRCQYVDKVMKNVPELLTASNIEPCVIYTEQCIQEIYENIDVHQKYEALSKHDEEWLTSAVLTITSIQQCLAECLSDLKQNNDMLLEQIMKYDTKHMNTNNHDPCVEDGKYDEDDEDIVIIEEEEDTEDEYHDIEILNKDNHNHNHNDDDHKWALNLPLLEYESNVEDEYQEIEKKKRKPKRKRKPPKINIVETAPINSRYFADDTDYKRGEISDNKKNYEDKYRITKQILKKANISINDLSQHRMEKPKRNLSLNDLKKYQIVLILGESGSGKTTLLKQLWQQNKACVTFCDPAKLLWNRDKSIISELGNDINGENATNEAMNIMQSIGLNSVPNWLKPYHILSQGEQYRATFARLLNIALQKENEFILMDEFSSVLDRQTAKCMSTSICKFIRKTNIDHIANFILASTNSDIVRYLQPNLLIALGGNNEMKLIENPHNLRDADAYKPDIRVVLDLPPFDQLRDNLFDLSQNMKLDQLSAKKQLLLNDNTFRRLQCNVKLDRHTEICDHCFDFTFDGNIITDIACLESHHFGEIFAIGVIFGSSGSGKTSTGERLFGKARSVKWDKNVNIAEHFASVEDLEEKMNAVCLPKRLCLSHFDQLSDGEQHRINIALQLGQNNVIIDEFTSYLDRDTAHKVALGVSRYIQRNNNQNIVLLACHQDIIEDLNPNWLFDIENKKVTHFMPLAVVEREHNYNINNSLSEKEHKFIIDNDMWSQVAIRIYLKPAKRSDFTPKFSKYHYLTSSILTNAKCFTAWASFSFSDESNLQIVGFVSFATYPFWKNLKNNVCQFQFREHRTVILPSYQGLGIGSRVSDAIAEYLALQGYRLQSKTAHPRYGMYRDRSSLWNATKVNHTKSKRNRWNGTEKSGKKKSWYCHVYKLPFQRNENQEKYLKSRVIVTKKYKIHSKAPYDPYHNKRIKR